MAHYNYKKTDGLQSAFRDSKIFVPQSGDHAHCTQGHDHSDGSSCDGHHHDHDHDHSHSNSLIRGGLEPHRGKVIIGLTGLVALGDYLAKQGVDIQPEFVVIGGATYVAFEASEHIMEAVEKLKIPGILVGTTLGAVHTLAEVFLAMSSAQDGHAGLGMASTMMSNEMHILFMAGGAALIGGISAAKQASWKMNSAAILSQTLAFAYQVETGFNPYLSSAQGLSALGFLGWRYFAKEACAAHGGNCGHVHKGVAFEGDLLNVDFWREQAEKVKFLPREEAIKQLNKSIHGLKEKLNNLSLPDREKIQTTLTNENLWGLGIAGGALWYCADKLGESVINVSRHFEISDTSAGLITGAANAAPEMIFVLAAAYKAASLKMDHSHSALHAAQEAKDTAWGAVTSCTVTTLGLASVYYGFNNVDVPETLRWVTTEGQAHLTTFVLSAGAIAAFTHEKAIEQLAIIDNKAADWLEDRKHLKKACNGVSKWLRNSGHSVSKFAAATLLAYGIGYNITVANLSGDEQDEAPHQQITAKIAEISQACTEQDNECIGLPIKREPQSEELEALQL